MTRPWLYEYDLKHVAIPIETALKWAKSFHISFEEITCTDVAESDREQERKMLLDQKDELLQKLQNLCEKLQEMNNTK